MPVWLTETPWWLPTALVIAGVAMLVRGNARRQRKLLGAGTGFVLLALMLATLSYLLESPRERAIRKTHELATAVQQQNWPAVSTLMADKTHFSVFNDRQGVLNLIKNAVARYGLKSVSVRSVQTDPDDDGFFVRFACVSDHNDGANNIITNWKLYWATTADNKDCVLQSIEYMGGPNLGIDLDKILKP